VIVRWGLGELGPVLAGLGSERALLITSPRFAGLEDLPVIARFEGASRHSPLATVEAGTAAASGADAVVGLGGGSAIDTAKAVSAATELPLVAVPTTYAGSEWTTYFGMRDEGRRVKTGGDGAHTAAIVYEPALTLGLPREETVGTALNALAHAAEALYVERRSAEGDEEALAGARLIGTWLPVVVEQPQDLEARTQLLVGAMHAGQALGLTGMGLAHAVAQALGGRYGLPHGEMNALALPPTLRFNTPVVPDAIARLADALAVTDAAARVEELARLGGFEGLAVLGVPEGDLPAVAEAAVVRPGARANPRPATPEDVLLILRKMY
jgi:maleylacetate reductase